MFILLFNAGSSSLKGSLVHSDTGQPVASAVVDWVTLPTQYRLTTPDRVVRDEQVHWKGYAQAVQQIMADLVPEFLPDISRLAAVGHRVVHGGDFTQPVRITDSIRTQIESLIQLAPLHNPPSLETITAAQSLLPDIPHIAVFDTAFHSTMPDWARNYPIPQAWRTEFGIRKFGFHGLSHEYASRRASELLNRPLSDLKLVICHLGHGCSATAVSGGKSVDTTMGFTPLEGLMMATRSGSIDPGIIPYLQSTRGLAAGEIEQALNRQSGLIAVSGISSDMRQVVQSAEQGNRDAVLALQMYTYRVRKAIGALAAGMGGIDALIFTAGVGENARSVRQAICSGLECLQLELDPVANTTAVPDSDIATASSRGRILIIAAREDLMMLEGVKKALREREVAGGVQ